MHPLPKLTDEEYERLKTAEQTKKFGHLRSWKELYIYQRVIATPQQVKQIAEFARKKNQGFPVRLPLMQYEKG